ncbi:MAG: hypothetical protein MHM6MM_003465 [Cercozoa sp. M6MM]
MWLAVHLALAMLATVSFCRVWLSDGGRVSHEVMNAPLMRHTASYFTHRGRHHAVNADRRRNGCRRFCFRCRHFKPDRAHHCDSCGHCVLAMDHHCVFFGRCVGHANQKFFFLFLLYTSLCGISMAITSYKAAFHALRPSLLFSMSWDESTWLLALQTALAFVGVVFAFALALFSLVSGFAPFVLGLTTLEMQEIQGHVRFGQPWCNPYNLDTRCWAPLRNIKRVMGPSVWLWLLPVRQDTHELAGYCPEINETRIETLRSLSSVGDSGTR